MSERTRMSLAREFCDLARASKVNCETSLDAQDFFKEHVMGLTKDQIKPATGVRSPQEKQQIRDAYFDGMEKVLKCLTGAEFQTVASYDTIMNMIPETEVCIRRNLRKVALEYGIVEPAGWGGK